MNRAGAQVPIFTQEVGDFFFLVFAYVLGMTVSVLLPLMAINAQRTLSSFIVFGGLAVTGGIVFTINLWQQLFAPRYLCFYDSSIELRFSTKNTKVVPAENVSEVQSFWGNRYALKILYRTAETNNVFFVHLDLIKYDDKPAAGLFLEEFLKTCSNLKKIDIDKSLEDQSFSSWGRLPDPEMLRRIKSQTEENGNK